MSWLRDRFDGSESGLTLFELLIAATMSVIIVGASASMLISTVRTQPQISERSQNVTGARWVLERLTREIRNGVRVDEATASSVSFVSKVRRTACGGTESLSASQPARECQITYDCSAGTSCSRTEAEKGDLSGGVATPLVSGIGSASVFNYSPSASDPTYIGMTLRVPNPSGSGFLTVSDGASLRTPTLLSTG